MTATQQGFAAPGEHADVAVVVVTYNSGDDLDGLLSSLRPETADQSLRVIVADNASSDDTLAVARSHGDVVAVETGGNLGYAGGINAAMRVIGDADAVLVLNPDLTVARGAVAALRARLQGEQAGAVVPTILDADDEPTASIRSEPSIVGALGDAAFGGRLRGRPGVLSETVFHPAAYTSPHRIDWATGAALLIDGDVARAVGAWDERFFLYSEETDFFRRVRESGHDVWFEPQAVVRHSQGGSGTSLDLDRLLAVNRIRYARKHSSRVGAAAFRAVVILHELVRVASPRHRAVLRTVASERSWAGLPHASRSIGSA